MNILRRPRYYDIAYGRHSNIPECCIEFFITDWDFNSEYGQLLHEINICEYVPCPKCFKEKTFNKLRICKRDCERECRKDFL